MKQTNLNNKASQKIADQTAEFLASGGVIEQVSSKIYDHEYSYNCPPLSPEVTDTRRARQRAKK